MYIHIIIYIYTYTIRNFMNELIHNSLLSGSLLSDLLLVMKRSRSLAPFGSWTVILSITLLGCLSKSLRIGCLAIFSYFYMEP